MSYVLTAIISMVFGAGIMACFKVSGGCSESERQKEALKEAHRIGYCEGHRNGLRWGKVLKIDAALYEELKARASGRVDVGPGPDSIRPEVKHERV